MSGGHFDYVQYRIDDAAIAVAECAARMKDDYDSKTIDRIEEASRMLQKAGKMLQRVDWLVCGDDGEDSFHRRWEEEGLEP